MTDVVIMAREVLPVGNRALGPVNIPTGIVAFGFILSKANWLDPAIKASLQIDVSLDGGGSWQPLGGFVDEPGGGTDVTFKIAEPANPLRQGRATVTIAGGALDTTVSVRLLTGLEPRVL